MRKIKSLVPGLVIDYKKPWRILNYKRDKSLNPDSVITDYILDSAGQVTSVLDGRGISYAKEYDSRGRNVATIEAVGSEVEARSETLYDANSNVIEKRSTRYFDEEDIAGYEKATTKFTYGRRNKLLQKVTAPASDISTIVDYSYYDDGRVKSTSNPYSVSESSSAEENRAEMLRLWHQCCGRPQATVDQAGHGQITNNDFYGNITHLINVSDVLEHSGSYHNPIDAKTLREVTRRYDSRHRLIAETVWLSPLGEVDPNNVPIAEDSSLGLTTSYVYYDSLFNEDGSLVDERLTSSYEQLQARGISLASGSARLVVNPEGEISVVVRDGLSRLILSGIIDKNNYNLLTYNTQGYDELQDGLLVNSSTSSLGNKTQKLIDAAGKVRVLIDAQGERSNRSYDANGNLISYRDANGVGQDCVYDARNRDTICTDTNGDETRKVYNAANQVIRSFDAKGQMSSAQYDSLGRKVVTTDRVLATTNYTYDSRNNLLSITDAEFKTTNYEYDRP